MSKEQPKTIPTFYALGALTNFEIWVAPTLPTLVSAVTGDLGYLSRDPAGRREIRERFACSLAAETQAALIATAVGEGTWSWEGASLPEIERLTRSRQTTDHQPSWQGGIPLILVRRDLAWKAPTGRVRVISAVTDSGLLWSAFQLGWLTAAGRLDSSGGVSEPRR